MESKQHWEKVYTTKGPTEVSWFQEYPRTVMEHIDSVGLSKTATIIDVGGGDSNFVNALLEKGFENIWVLDISAAALEKVKKRLGERAALVHWVVSDITEFAPEAQFDFWYDRAVFHFLPDRTSINRYKDVVSTALRQGGEFFLGTFSENGPLKCSGLEIRRYSETEMKAAFVLRRITILHLRQYRTFSSVSLEKDRCGKIYGQGSLQNPSDDPPRRSGSVPSSVCFQIQDA